MAEVRKKWKSNNFLLEILIKQMENFHERWIWIRFFSWIPIQFIMRSWTRIWIRSISERIQNPDKKSMQYVDLFYIISHIMIFRSIYTKEPKK